MIVFIVAGLFTAFQAGLDRGLEHTIGAEAYGRISFAFCAAITDLAHHGPGGHVCNEVIEEVLAYAGLTGDESALTALGKKFPENLQDETLIDAAINKAVAFPLLPSNNKYRGSGSDDLGMSDFAELGFALFGYKLLSLYLTYFLLFGASVWVFFRAFGERPAFLAVLTAAVIAHLAIINSAIFDFTAGTFGTVTNPRFLSALSVIPALHVALSMTTNPRVTCRTVIPVTFQASLIVFAISIRAVALWVLFGGAGLAVLLWIFRRSPRSLWPFATTLAIFFAYNGYEMSKLDRVYQSSGGTGYHTVWHSIYYSLQWHPDWNLKYGDSHRHATGDMQPWAGAENYLTRHPLQDGDPPLYFADHYPNYVAMEKYVRGAFFELARNDPKFIIEAFLIYKPLGLYYVTKQYFLDALHLRGNSIWLSVIIIGFSTIFFSTQRDDLIDLFKVSAIVTGMFFASIAPLIISIPTISDDLYVLTICTGLWVLIFCAFLGRLTLLAIVKGTQMGRQR